MKKAFTLIEMMVVVLILAVLMSIMFRIGNIGTESEAKIITILRLQRLENCLSGYNACFGTYPPVPVQGSRSIYSAVSDHGVQVIGSKSEDVWGKDGSSADKRSKQFNAACKAQPIEIMFPWSKGKAGKGGYVDGIGDEMSRRSLSRAEEYMNYWGDPRRARILDANYDGGSVERFTQNGLDKVYDWRNVQLFKFGLLSFILPRYLVMMNGLKGYYSFKQWTANNTLPCDPFTGRTFNSWAEFWALGNDEDDSNPKPAQQAQVDRAKMATIPSQAACARWMPNLEGIIRTNLEGSETIYFYGISIADDTTPKENPNMRFHVANEKVATNGSYEGLIFSPYPPTDVEGGDQFTDQYCLDRMTVVDGWGHGYYYYSPSPYQTYQLWSGGANNQTFPPWISLKKLSSAQASMVADMVKDDIIRLSK